MTAPVFSAANFRQQFPAYAGSPDATLQLAWSMGANWISQSQDQWWGIGSENPAQLQQAADLMGAVVMYQLYGSGGPNGTSGPINSATQGSVNVSFTLPEFGSSALASLLLTSPPYGTMLLALLDVASSVGPYISSGRFAYVPP
jgi:hypothetical protein